MTCNRNSNGFATQGIREMFSDEPLPSACVSINAYLGAPGIVEALRLGAECGDYRSRGGQRRGQRRAGA